MLGERWCLIAWRLGLSNCDRVHPPPSEGRGKSEKLKSHNFLRTLLHASRSGPRAEAVGHEWSTGLTQVVAPQLLSLMHSVVSLFGCLDQWQSGWLGQVQAT